MNINTASINLAQYRAMLAKREGKQRKPRRPRPEEVLQRACIEWADAHRSVYPDLEYLFHPANGGGRTAAEAGVLKATGVRSGVSDLLLPFISPANGLHGLALELKSPTGKLSDSQQRWLTRFAHDGYLSAVIRNINDFIKCVKAWYGLAAVEVDADFEIISGDAEGRGEKLRTGCISTAYVRGDRSKPSG